jgi:hypothetical protein
VGEEEEEAAEQMMGCVERVCDAGVLTRDFWGGKEGTERGHECGV